ncbi:zinc-finger domain containing protein [Plasmodium gonderi]|uniref:Zinc-finger domain containing protein n=1 Tax=Plasmodium gonderi TaxID=77519 RepID=A0A1Y1JGM2_PLAGO|nr:zinc-finger domain containing protein [Plasmodium gonderi]GAW81671.1 zinc-finger domain containing protein [Plasmodium gonderi]
METDINNETRDAIKEDGEDEGKNPLDDTIEVRSMCINCEQEGTNKIVKLQIPYFKNILIHSFECEFCNYKNNVIQDLNTIKEKGIKIIFKISKREHMDRQLVKSEYGVLRIPQIDFEIPKETQKGSINTIEGFLQTALSNLSEYLRNLKQMYNEVNGLTKDVPAQIVEEEANQVQHGENSQNNASVGIQNMETASDDQGAKKKEEIESMNEYRRDRNEIGKGEYSNNANEEQSNQQMTIENYIKLIETTVQNLSIYVVSKELPFTIEIVDPSGLSSLEHYDEDIKSNTVKVEYYERNKQELNEMGFYEEDFEDKMKERNLNPNGNEEKQEDIDGRKKFKKENYDFIKKYVYMNGGTNNNDERNNTNGGNTAIRYKNISEEEEDKLIESFASNCPCCNYMGANNFCEINIPGFKKCLIMSYVCTNCNFKTSEIKSSGEINPKGKKITLTVKSKSDLNRFVIKSEMASIHIPIVDLISDYGTLGGSLTTIEGLILKIIESLEDKFKFLLGDSSTNMYNYDNKNDNTTEGMQTKGKTNGNLLHNNEISSDESITNKVKTLIANLYKLCKTNELCPFDIIIDDIASNSYISSDNIGHDDNLKEEEYERTFEQNDMLGITSMITENY